MNPKPYLKNLEKRKIISKKPHPIIPFLLTTIILMLYILASNVNNVFNILLLILAIFSFLFSIIHLIVFIILNKN